MSLLTACVDISHVLKIAYCLKQSGIDDACVSKAQTFFKGKGGRVRLAIYVGRLYISGIGLADSYNI